MFVGPEFGTVQRADLMAAAREAAEAGFDVVVACAFNNEAHATEFDKLGKIPVLKARVNAGLHMAEDLKATGKGNLFVVFGEPDIEVLKVDGGRVRVNYRTSHQIHEQADRLLGPTVTDADGEEPKRDDTVSVFNGPSPEVRVFGTAKDEVKGVGAWLADRLKGGLQPHEVGVFVRADEQVDRAKQAVAAANGQARLLDDHVEVKVGCVSVGTLHLAKGLEFRAVAVMACDDEVIPSRGRIAAVGDDADLRKVYDSERYLRDVACTRARDHLLVTGSEPASEFLADLQ